MRSDGRLPPGAGVLPEVRMEPVAMLTALGGSRWAQQDWFEGAACKGLTDLFFPPPGEREAARLQREPKARSVCESCPAMDPCREYARRQQEFGFWGGENEEERFIAIRRERRMAARLAG
jgi:WhiB family redox-sensing transcriptional regulator